jgi:hypothetical protein
MTPLWLLATHLAVLGGGMLAGSAFTMAVYAGRCL